MPVCNLADLKLLPTQCLLGLDYGQKRIGLAIADPGLTVATPLAVLERGKLGELVVALQTIITERGVGALVLGLPLDMNGNDTPMSQSVRTLAKNLAPLNLPICFWDERFSTASVTRDMIERADLSRAKRAAVVDAAAAAYMLQGAVDFLKKNN
jgi:putative Holliday junction resolvase